MTGRGFDHDGGDDWWRQAVVYQVYIRSFADANGDGVGDLPGLTDRLPYIARLGVDAIWLNPWYASPLNDGGYDVADYRTIEPLLGSLSDAERLIAEAHGSGIRVLIDMVPNHTSSEHPWFVEAIAGGPGHPARDRYHFLPGAGPEGSEPPNDWLSFFGGPAWTRVEDGEWYLHLFDATQPDLNWSHEPVRTEFESILRFWLDRGVDGFRVDAAPGLMKDPGYADLGRVFDLEETGPDHPYWDRDEVHEIYRRWRFILDGYGSRVMVAEAPCSRERLALYRRPDEFHQAFDFAFLKTGWFPAELRSVIEQSIENAVTVGSMPSWVLSSHDEMRHATRLGLPPGISATAWMVEGPPELLDVALGNRRARAAALMMLALPGSVYLYQGEELGLPEVWDLPDDRRADPVWERSEHKEKGRDGCRVPIPWTTSGTSLGFGAGEAWLPQPEVFSRLAVSSQDADDESMLQLYRQAIRIRRGFPDSDERVTMLELGPDVLAFVRPSGLACLVNMGAQPVDVPPGDLLLSSGTSTDGMIGPDEAVWVRLSS